MASAASNKIKYLLAKKVVDFSADTFKAILMQSGFTFDKDTHHGYADVSASELATGNGYIAGGATLAGVTVTENDTDDRCDITWNNVSWVASGGSIGPAAGMIIYDDTVTTPTADPVICYIDFGSDKTQADGGTVTISSVGVRIA